MKKYIFGFFYLVAKIKTICNKVFNKLFKIDQLIYLWRSAYWKSKSMKLGNNVKFYKGVIIYAPNLVKIGQDTGIGDYVQMWGGGGIEIGKNVLIATHSVITSQGHDVDAELFRLTTVKQKVIIEENVWLGAGVLVMPGVTIGKNSIIGAGSVVVKSIPENSIAVGAPAKVIKNREK